MKSPRHERKPAHTADDEARTTALGLWRYGFDYLKASNAVDEADTNPWVSSQTSYHLACHSLELAFKSYLRAKGYTLTLLQNKVGHNLLSAVGRCATLGLKAIPPEHRVAINTVAPYHLAHESRYIKTGVKDYPPLDALISAGAWALDAAAPEVAEDYSRKEVARNESGAAIRYRMQMDVSAKFGKTPPPAPLT